MKKCEERRGTKALLKTASICDFHPQDYVWRTPHVSLFFSYKRIYKNDFFPVILSPKTSNNRVEAIPIQHFYK